MPELPMTAFEFRGEDGQISLTIDEVFGFPLSPAPYISGGFESVGTVSISSSNYSMLGKHYFTTGELAEFQAALEVCHKNLEGEAALPPTYERDLELKVKFDKTGHVEITGEFWPSPEKKNCLQFEISADQTQIKQTLTQLEAVKRTFKIIPE